MSEGRIWLNGKKLISSKQDKNLIKRSVLGNDIVNLPKPAPKGIIATEDINVPADSEHHFGLEVPVIGRISGYAEAYSEPLTGNKSDQVGRSNGFFVYVRGRLINVSDGHFGIDPDELRQARLEAVRVLGPQLIVQEHPHSVESGGPGPAQLDMDAQGVEGVGLEHLQLVDGGGRDVVGADEPALRPVPAVGALG